MKNIQQAVFIDADNQHFAEDIESLLNELNDTNADLIIGNRLDNDLNNIPMKRLLYNNIANIITNLF